MAKGKPNPNPRGRKNGNGESATETHTPLSNSAAIDDAIQAAFNKILGLNAEKKRLEDKHLAGVKKNIREAWKTLSADTDIPLKRLQAMYKLLALEAEAAGFDEETAVNDLRDDFKTIMGALQKGGMVDWVAALQNHVPRAERQAAEAQADASQHEDDVSNAVH